MQENLKIWDSKIDMKMKNLWLFGVMILFLSSCLGDKKMLLEPTLTSPHLSTKVSMGTS